MPRTSENGARPAVAEGVGQNYFEICRDAALVGCPPGTRAAAGITRVLRRELPIFTLDYACHGGAEQRWFMLTVTPLESGAVIAHTDITARRRTEMSAAALIETGRELAGGLEPAEVARQVASSVVRVFGVQRSALYRLERDADRLERALRRVAGQTEARIADPTARAEVAGRARGDRSQANGGRQGAPSHVRDEISRGRSM